MKVCIVALVVLFALPVFAAVPDEVLGIWKTNGDLSRIELYKCGDKVCGKVSWLKEPKFVRKEDGPVGEVKIDWRNPNPSLQKRPVLGMQVMAGLTYTGDNKWEKGLCYDPQSGNSYKCNMRLVSPDKLDLRGYIGFSFIGRTYTLNR